jgi:hypothetical protein
MRRSTSSESGSRFISSIAAISCRSSSATRRSRRTFAAFFGFGVDFFFGIVVVVQRARKPRLQSENGPRRAEHKQNLVKSEAIPDQTADVTAKCLSNIVKQPK